MSPKFPDSIVIDEVLPPKGKTGAASGAGGAQPSELSRFLAKWLDDLLKIPGTNFKIGLDPLLAFIPVIGDAMASGSGLLIILDAVRSGVSMPVLLRMAANLGLNSIFDLIPGAGPVVSAFFKSNSRNIELLQRWQTGQQHAVHKSSTRLFFAFALLVGMMVALWMFSFWMFLHYVLGVV